MVMLDRQQPLKVGQDGGIVEAESPKKGTVIKPQRWHSREIDRLREKLNRQEPLKVTPNGEIVDESSPEKGTVIKPQRWFITTIDRLRGNKQRPLNNPFGENEYPGASGGGTVIKSQRWYMSWWERNPGRLVLELKIMRDRYPQFELKNVDGRLVWHGFLRSNRGNYYEIAVVYPDNFPYEAPKAYILEPKISGAKHMFSDGSLCLFAPFDRTWEEKTTAATIVTWVATWIFAYEMWKETGEWPGRSAD